MNQIFVNKKAMMTFLIMLSLQFPALTGIRIELSDLVIMCIILLSAVRIGTTNNDYKIRINSTSLIVIGLLVIVLISAINGGARSLVASSKFFKSMALFFLIVNLVTDKKTIFLAIKMLILGTTISAIIGICQEIIFIFAGVPIVGFVSENVMKVMFQETSFGILLRVPAFTGIHGILAFYLAISIIIAINLFLYGLIKKRKDKIVFSISTSLMFIALLLTFSDSAILACIITAAISVILRWPNLIIHFTVILLAVLILSYITGIVEDFKTTINTDISLHGDLGGRLQLARESIEGFFARHSLIGAGIGRGASYTLNVNNWPVHNSFLLAAVEIGSLGLLVFILLFVLVLKRQLKAIVQLTNSDEKGMVKSLLLGMVALIINTQFHPSYIDGLIFMYIALIDSASMVLIENRRNDKSELLREYAI